MKLQELLEKEGISKNKYTLNTPKSVVVKINSAMKVEGLSEQHKRTLQEIKGILIGKYPSKQVLENSLKGLQKKISSLNESKISKINKLLLTITITLLTACNTAEIVSKNPDINRTSIEREVSSPDVLNVIQIERETWDSIELAAEQLKSSSSVNEIESDLDRYSRALSEYNPNPEHMQIMITEARKRGIEPSLVLALVAQESSFRESAINNNNRNGTNDYGYFQLNSRWHEQHKGDVPSHIKTALDHLKWCLRTENGDITRALSRYNTGRPDLAVGERYAQRILSIQSDIEAIKIASR